MRTADITAEMSRISKKCSETKKCFGEINKKCENEKKYLRFPVF